MPFWKAEQEQSATPQMSQQEWQEYMDRVNQQNKALQQQLELQKQQLASQPKRPEFKTPLDSETWTLPEHLQVQDLYDPTALNKIKEEAYQTDVYASPWAKLMQEKVAQEQAMGMDTAAQQQASSQAQAQAQLAMRGGLGGGAAERLAQAGARQEMLARQGVARQGTQARLGIGMQGEEMRQAALGALPGMELSRAQYSSGIQGANIGNIFDQAGQINDANLRKYEAQMAAWAAQKQAEATRSSSSGGCFPAGTLIKMKDGSQRPIEDIEIGDITKYGEVYKVVKAKMVPGQILYNWRNVLVTDSHAVKEDGVWKRVFETDDSIMVDFEAQMNIFCFACQDHRIEIKGELFADYDEHGDTSLSYEDAIKLLNEEEDEPLV
jgi:hypothetical protein